MKNILLLIFLLVFLCADEKDKEQNQEQQQKIYIDIVGTWDQYIYYYKDGEYAYHYVCTFRILKNKDQYELKMVATKKNPEIIESIGVTEIKFDGKTWTFYSDWGEYGIGFFQLDMKERNVFEGYSYATNKKKKPTYKLDKNRWVRHDL